jgi:hypothetical protein
MLLVERPGEGFGKAGARRFALKRIEGGSSNVLASIRTVLVFAAISAAAYAHDVSGKGTFQVETDAGSGSPTFVLKQTGEKLTGTYTGLFGTAELTGTVKGDDIEFSFEAEAEGQKLKVVYKGKIESDGKMKGSADLGGMGSGTWTGAKQ